MSPSPERAGMFTSTRTRSGRSSITFSVAPNGLAWTTTWWPSASRISLAQMRCVVSSSMMRIFFVGIGSRAPRRTAWKVDGEGAPLAEAALDLDATAEERPEGAGDDEAEAGALVRLGERVLELAEGDEEAAEILLADARPGVTDGEPHPLPLAGSGEHHLALLRELGRVGGEVHQDLAELVPVGLEGEAWRCLHPYADRLLPDQQPGRAGDVLEQGEE